MCLCPHGSWLKTQFLFIWRVTGAFLEQSLGHRVKKKDGSERRHRRELQSQRPWLLTEGRRVIPERSSRCRGGLEKSKVTHRPVLTERFWPRNLRRWGGPCSQMQAWAQSSAVLARVSSHTWTRRHTVGTWKHYISGGKDQWWSCSKQQDAR